MARSTKEWVGKNDDDWPPTWQCQLRVIERSNGRCAICQRPFDEKLKPQIDHVRSLKSGKLYPGENLNRESNLQALCVTCHTTIKTPEDQKKHAEVARYERNKYGIKPKREKRKPMPGSRQSRWKKKFDGTVIDRATGLPWSKDD